MLLPQIVKNLVVVKSPTELRSVGDNGREGGREGERERGRVSE